MRSRRHKLQVSTFPFLAVLLCAMGALLLVLLVMDRRAHAAALQRAEQALRQTVSETQREEEARLSALETARNEAHDAWEQKRAAAHSRLESQIGEVDAKIQALRGQMAKAAERLLAEQDEETALKRKIETEHAQAKMEEQALIQVRAAEATKTAQSESSRQVLKQLTGELARLEQALADLKAAREKEKNTYSVVPYNGKQGENRRPLYVECAADEVIFHPDHMALGESHGSSEVEAEVERRLLRQKRQLPAAQADAYTPYLMLLVRPDGVLSYYHFRESLRGLKIDFGYEFIDKDWVLDFPADDAAPVPQSWVTTTKPADAPPQLPSSASNLHIAGVPTPGQDGPPPPPYPTGGSPGTAGSLGPLTGSGVAGSGAPHGVLPGRPGGNAGFGLGGEKGEGPSFGSSGGGSPRAADILAPFPSGGVAMNSGPHGVLPGKSGGDAGSGPGTEAGQSPSLGGPMGDGSGSGGTGSTAPPPPPGPFLIPPSLGGGSATGTGGSAGGPPGSAPGGGSAGGPPGSAPRGGSAGGPPGSAPRGGPAGGPPGSAPAGGSPSGPPGSAPAGSQSAGGAGSQSTGSAGSPGAGAPPPPPDPAKVLPELGPPRVNTGQKAESGEATPAGNSGPTDGQPAPPGTASRTATGDGDGNGGDQGADDPFLRATPTPKLPKAPRTRPALRPARLSGDRDWIVFVECKTEGVVIYPNAFAYSRVGTGEHSTSRCLAGHAFCWLIDRKQATVRR